MLVIGLDIGGANLKAATSDGQAIDRAFPLWKQPQMLASELAAMLAELPRADAIAVTMTGELADCYPSRPAGVRKIVAAVEQATTGVPTAYWQTGGEFLEAGDAVEYPRLVSSANWHALATFCGRLLGSGPGLMIDVGSTTTDLIPLHDGRVAAAGLTDLERLRSGELVYTGATRTPVCALGPTIEIDGRSEAIAAELFATMRDVYLVLGRLPEAQSDLDTADCRPATVEHARLRLARMLCVDLEDVGVEMIDRFATALAARQQALIDRALNGVLDRIAGRPDVLICGSGAFVAERAVAGSPRLAGARISLLAEMFERRVSCSACAYAVARLAVEQAPF